MNDQQQTKRDYRAAVSREHARTRGIASAALSNTVHLRRWVRYQTIGLVVELVAILGLVYWFTR